MAIGISIVAVYIFSLYSLLDMKYVTVKVTDPVHPNETLWVTRLSSFYKDNKVTIDIVYNHQLTHHSLSVPGRCRRRHLHHRRQAQGHVGLAPRDRQQTLLRSGQ